MTIRFHRAHILILFEVWWIIFTLVGKTSLVDTWVGVFVSAISLLLVPGIATMLLMRLRGLDLWTYGSLALGLSIVELMTIGLVSNTVLPYFGFDRPLDFPVLLSVISICVVGLMTAQWMRRESLAVRLKKYVFVDTTLDLVMVLIPLVLVALSVLGAIVLNNGGSGAIAYASLLAIVVYASILLWQSEKLGENVIPTALFFIALSLLFMTSLRGWYITGHDIQREFEVFQLAHNAGRWSIQSFKDAYNACLSITILPSMLAEFMRISDPAIFKILFQICFATVPSMLFLIMRRMVRPMIALTTALYFLAFPTFFSDMPFLNRQEIAFLFLFLMFLVITEEGIAVRLRRVLFVFFGIGMIFSHYSTTYTVIALLAFTVVAGPVLRYVGPRLAGFRIFERSGIAALRGNDRPARITFVMVFVLAGASFLWSSVLTDTSSNSLTRVVVETARVIRANSHNDFRSNDVLYGLFSSRSLDPAQSLASYEATVVARRRASEPDAYASEAVLRAYPVVLTVPPVMPLTALGNSLQSAGIDVVAFNTAIRQSSAKVLQLLMLIGFCVIWLRSANLRRPLDSEWVSLMSGSVLLLLAITVLPVLSAEYGLLRAFQQSLLFLGLCIVLGNLALLQKLGGKIARAAAGAVVILFLASTTGIITQTLGGYDAQLHLNNAGSAYNLYYMHRGDIMGTAWLLQEMHRNGVVTYQSGLATNVLPLLPSDLTNGIEVVRSIYPGLIRTQSYVLIGSMTLNDGRGSLVSNGDVLMYIYPRAFLDDTKDLIYNNGSIAVYR